MPHPPSISQIWIKLYRKTNKNLKKQKKIQLIRYKIKGIWTIKKIKIYHKFLIKAHIKKLIRKIISFNLKLIIKIVRMFKLIRIQSKLNKMRIKVLFQMCLQLGATALVRKHLKISKTSFQTLTSEEFTNSLSL